jgi:hypothetical protein
MSNSGILVDDVEIDLNTNQKLNSMSKDQDIRYVSNNEQQKTE